MQCHKWVIEVSNAAEGRSKTTLQKLNAFYMYFGPIVATMIMTVSISLCAYPIYVYLTTQRKEWICTFFIPFVDRTTTAGYFTHIFAQATQVNNTGFKFSFTDTIFFYYLFFAGAYEELVEHKCLLLSEAIKECEKTHKYPTVQMQRKFHDLLIDAIKENQKMDL